MGNKNKKWYNWLVQALVNNGQMARDARIGAVGADQVRQLYKEGEDNLAAQLAKNYTKANAAGIMIGAGGAGTAASIAKNGWIPTLVSEVASGATGYGGYKVGEYLDNKLNTKWLGPTFGFISGIGGGISGYKGLVKAGSKGWLKGSGNMYGKQFIDNVAADALNSSNTTFAGNTASSKQISFTPNQKTSTKTSYRLYERPSKLTEAERLGIPKGERNQPLNGHLKGDAAVQMFKEYEGITIPSNSKIYSQIQQLVPEARERYNLVGRTDITDDEIARSLYKRAMELNGNGNAAIWAETGEPRLLFRGDTQRYNRLKDKWSPEELAKRKGTMDNSLGNLFLGDISDKGQGVDRYFISGNDFDETIMQGSSTGARGKLGTIFAVGDSGLNGTSIPYIPKDAYKLSTDQSYCGPYSVYKFPGKYSESGISDLNTFVTRTPAMRDATGEISVLADDVIMKTKNYRGPNINDYDGPTYDAVNSTTRDAMAKHYQSVLEDAQSKGQGLLFSEGLTDEYVKKFGEIHPFRREHEWYDYYALPNFNRQNAKHLFGWDLRRPVQWDVDNIYLEKGGKL